MDATTFWTIQVIWAAIWFPANSFYARHAWEPISDKPPVLRNPIVVLGLIGFEWGTSLGSAVVAWWVLDWQWGLGFFLAYLLAGRLVGQYQYRRAFDAQFAKIRECFIRDGEAEKAADLDLVRGMTEAVMDLPRKKWTG